MRCESLFRKLTHLSHARPSLWRSFLAGWLHRRQNGFVPCAVAGCDRLLQIPLQDFYESYEFFCESPQGCRELACFLGHLRANEVFYDVGAFRGAYSTITKLKLRDNVSIHAFEPVAKNVEAIRRICALNRFDNFTITPLAVGDGNSLKGKLNEQDVVMFRLGDGEASPGEVEFPAVSLDEYIARGAPAPSVVKIDVDGFELSVLRGARACLARHRPRLWMEVHPGFLKAQKKSPDDVLNLLRETGYTIVFYDDYNLPGATVSYHIWCE